jgi:nicotinate-nucleotide adenylyltransferase
VADEVCEALRLDRLLLVPAAQPPHKPAAELAPAAHRYRMTALAVQEHPRFEVSDVEVTRSGPSYTVDTLTALQDRGRLHLIIGSETFLDLLNWREPRRVAALARLVVIPRNGMGFDPETPAALKVMRELGLPGFVPVGV